MDMKINSQLIKNEREIRAWSQQHLAEVSELSLRTIQRVENSGNASPESTKAIAVSLDLKPHDLYIKVDEQPNKYIHKFKLAIENIFKAINFKSAITSLAVLTPILYVSFFTLYSNNVIAEATSFKFSGEVRVNNSTLAFDVSVPYKQVHVLEIDSEHQLLFITPDKNGKRAKTEIRLLQYNGASYDIMHKATVIGSNAITRSFSYRVCDNKSTFYNRGLSKIPTCE